MEGDFISKLITICDSLENLLIDILSNNQRKELNKIKGLLDQELIVMLINDFLDENLSYLIYQLISIGNGYKLNIFYNNLKKMEALINKNILSHEKLHLQLMKIYLHIENDKNVRNQLAKDFIIKFSKERNNEYIDEIFRFAISNNQFGIIDKLKYHVNIEKYIDKRKEIKSVILLLQMRGNKLIKFLN